MARIDRPEDIQYLCFEGGGGKGVTFLGAIQALQELGVLPIAIPRPGRSVGSQIRGISGASAGAITALIVAMGADAIEMEDILNSSRDFNNFFDDPQMGYFRAVDRYNRPQFITASPTRAQERAFVDQRIERIREWLISVPSEARQYFPASIRGVRVVDVAYYALFPFLEYMEILPAQLPLTRKLRENRRQYFYNLIYDGGFFPGRTARQFLARKIEQFLGEDIRRTFGTGKDPGQLTFFEFQQITGVELAITGTNVSRQRPGMFSPMLTPDFPVVEAVGISMNLPFIFKPVRVYVDQPQNYNGLWIDGGILNNLPIHAFDYTQAPCSNAPNLKPLNPHVLGLRLTPPRRTPPSETSPTSMHFTDLLGSFVDTVFYPSEEGQLRSEEEAEQTISLNTFNLSTFDFAPPRSERDRAARAARESTYRYFRLVP